MRRILSFVVLLAALPAGAEDIFLKVGRAAQAPVDPYAAAWEKAEAVSVPLMAQTIAPPGGGGAVASVELRALANEREISFLLHWADASADEDASRPEGFPDAAALQFPALPGELPSPFMGDADRPVVIWRWSASAQKDIDAGYQDSAAGRPRKYGDLYAYADERAFRAAEEAGNIRARRSLPSPVEQLAARGFGSLSALPEQTVGGRGAWKSGRWSVVLRRERTGMPDFWDGRRVPVAVALWDGGKRERNGSKSVSVWHTALMPGAKRADKEAPAAAGRRHYERFGCGRCHGREALGGVNNANAQTDPIPGLNRVQEGFTREELKSVLFEGREPARADPAGPPAPYRMNAWKGVLSDEEADRVIDYLFSLMPKDAETW